MANSFTASFDEVFSRRMQKKHYVKDVYRMFANFQEEAILKKGDTVNRPFRSDLAVDDYTRGTAVTIQDISDSNEQLLVQTSKVVGFYVDKFRMSTLNFLNCWKPSLSV